MNWIALERALWTVIIEPAVIIFGFLFVLAVLFGAMFLVVYPTVCLVEWIYGLFKRHWYRQYFGYKKLRPWYRDFIYNRLFKQRWFYYGSETSDSGQERPEHEER
jgi:hypothetical protein